MVVTQSHTATTAPRHHPIATAVWSARHPNYQLARSTSPLARAAAAVVVAVPIVAWIGLELRHGWHRVKARLEARLDLD